MSCAHEWVDFWNESSKEIHVFPETDQTSHGRTTRSKDATRGSWPYYWEQGRYRNLGLQAIFTEAARTSLEAAWHSEFLSKKG